MDLITITTNNNNLALKFPWQTWALHHSAVCHAIPAGNCWPKPPQIYFVTNVPLKWEPNSNGSWNLTICKFKQMIHWNGQKKDTVTRVINKIEPMNPPAIVKYSFDAMSALKICISANTVIPSRRDTAADGPVGRAVTEGKKRVNISFILHACQFLTCGQSHLHRLTYVWGDWGTISVKCHVIRVN